MAHNFAFVNSEGEIKGIVSPGSDGQYTHLKAYEPNGDIAVIIPEDIFDFNMMNTGWYNLDTNEWKTRSLATGSYYEWKNKQWTLNSLLLEEEIRELRNEKLEDSDWTQYNDSPLSDEKKVEWRTYRQQLRDLMANLPSDLDDLDDVSWPTKPS